MAAETQPQEMPTHSISQPPPVYGGGGAQQQQQQQQQQHKAYSGPVVHATPLHQLGSMPALIDCPFCNARAPTRVDEHDSSMTIVAGIGIALVCICLSCLPCILHWFSDIDHYCTNCFQRVAHIPHGGVPQLMQPSGHIPQQQQQQPQYHMGNQPQYGAQSPAPRDQGVQSPPPQQHDVLSPAPQGQGPEKYN